MQRKTHSFTLHGIDQQTHTTYHHHRVAGFDGHYHVLEIFLHTNAQELHATLHNTFRRISIAAHDAVAQRTVVHTNADGRAVLTANA